jgi:hypothetical protein
MDEPPPGHLALSGGPCDFAHGPSSTDKFTSISMLVRPFIAVTCCDKYLTATT